MIGLLDPALFFHRNHADAQRDLDMVLLACRSFSIKIPPIDEYWDELWKSLGKELEKSAPPQTKRTLQEIRRLGTRCNQPIPPLETINGNVWRKGFVQLFSEPYVPAGWEQRMFEASMRASATGEDVVLFTRRCAGRNLNIRSSGHCILQENTRWLLHVQPNGIGHVHIKCIHHPRNLTEPWTIRFDWRLPGNRNGERYPFCPPDNWWKGSTLSVRTISSKPAWIDVHANGWARPNIPGGAGYHWDVFITDHAIQGAVGLNQINIVEYGAPNTEGTPGDIHHVPDGKEGKLTGAG